MNNLQTMYISIALLCISTNFSLRAGEIISPESCTNSEKSTIELQAECLIKEAKKLDCDIPEEFNRIKTIIHEYIQLMKKAPQQPDFDSLECAILSGDIELLKLLLKNRANPKFKGKYGRTSYNYLARYTSERILNQKENKALKRADPVEVKKLLDTYAQNF